jgi:hypothetical protein
VNTHQPHSDPWHQASDSLQNVDASTPETVAAPRQRRILLPILLFAATCLSTWLVGGLAFLLALMTTLLAHELGHFLQARRYHVPASFPYFIPMPSSPIGTMGAIIAMQPGRGDRRALFDIALTGPVAGLVPALVFSVVGLMQSQVVQVGNGPAGLVLGEPLLFRLLAYATFGPLPEGQDIQLHPVAFAGWVGLHYGAEPDSHRPVGRRTYPVCAAAQKGSRGRSGLASDSQPRSYSVGILGLDVDDRIALSDGTGSSSNRERSSPAGQRKNNSGLGQFTLRTARFHADAILDVDSRI